MISWSFPISELEYFLLIMTRVTCFIFIAPFFGQPSVPARVKIGFGFFTSVLIYYLTMPHTELVMNTVLEIAILVLKEAAAGLLIGFGANICTSIVLFAGRTVDMEMGLAMASQLDPTTNQEATMSGVYYQYLVMLLMITSGMYQYFISAITETFTLIPVGNISFNMDAILDGFIRFLGDYMVIGMQLALPVFCTIMLLNAVLGILAKIAPQMNMFAVGMQLKVMTGLIVLFITVGLMPAMADLIFNEMKKILVVVVEGLMDAPL